MGRMTLKQEEKNGILIADYPKRYPNALANILKNALVAKK